MLTSCCHRVHLLGSSSNERSLRVRGAAPSACSDLDVCQQHVKFIMFTLVIVFYFLVVSNFRTFDFDSNLPSSWSQLAKVRTPTRGIHILKGINGGGNEEEKNNYHHELGLLC